MNKLTRNAALALIGLAFSAAALTGLLAGSDHTPEDTAPEREQLDLDAYCRDRYGDQALAYQPSQMHRWACSTWQSGMWGNEPVSLAAACRSQRGESARSERVESSSLPPDQQVVCVV